MSTQTLDTEKIDSLIAELATLPDNHEFNRVCQELMEIMGSEEALVEYLVADEQRCIENLDECKVRLAECMARMASGVIAVATPVQPDLSEHLRGYGGPVTEIALAALHLLQYAGDIVPLDSEMIEHALEAPDLDPDFSDYRTVFASAVALLSTAAYFTLDPKDSFEALASEPPAQETFPPMPFPRVWVEMNHLRPFMHFHDDKSDLTEADQKRSRRTDMDAYGVGIAEVEQGTVWDIYLPFRFDKDSEFYFLAVRVGPDRIIDYDRELLRWKDEKDAFREIRALAVGAVHLITARNVEHETITMPRHQRKRLPEVFKGRVPKLYYVNLATSGEHGGTVGDREYHCRWLVRGHWRHIASGKNFCTCCDPSEIASWVDPYVKGPVGMPWKGRQVRRQTL